MHPDAWKRYTPAERKLIEQGREYEALRSRAARRRARPNQSADCRLFPTTSRNGGGI